MPPAFVYAPVSAFYTTPIRTCYLLLIVRAALKSNPRPDSGRCFQSRWLEDGQLCPTPASRVNYIHWIEDLLHLHPPPRQSRGGGGAQNPFPNPSSPGSDTNFAESDSSGGQEDVGGREGEVRGVDIGMGANCIYPLLGASICGWRFVGTGTFALSSFPGCTDTEKGRRLFPA